MVKNKMSGGGAAAGRAAAGRAAGRPVGRAGGRGAGPANENKMKAKVQKQKGDLGPWRKNMTGPLQSCFRAFPVAREGGSANEALNTGTMIRYSLM